MIPARDCFEPMMISAEGARLRAARFTADENVTARGICVLLNGQTEFIEKYFEVIDELRGRGFAVAALDWRGQGGSGRRIPQSPLKAHIDDFSEYDADMAALMEQLVLPMRENGARIFALGHSMGGHVLLRYLHRHPDSFHGAVFSAPMVMFSTRGQPRWLVGLVAAAMMAGGFGTDFVWGMAGRDPLRLTFQEQIVTSDPARYQRTRDFLAQHPALRLGGPTWGWVAAAMRSIAQLTAPDYATKISTPTLICGAGHDLVCVSEAARSFAQAMPQGTYLEIANAEHEILMERDSFRTQFWDAFDGFIARHA